MEAYMERSKTISGYVDEIEKTVSLDTLKHQLTALIDFASDKSEGCKLSIQEAFVNMVIRVSQPFIKPHPEQKKNVVYIPPDAGLLMMIPTCVPLAADVNMFFDGLRNFLLRCDEFVAPIENIVTVDEMDLVLENAQKKYRILDIIAPTKPLKIISLDHSHVKHNSECGISNPPENREPIIFVYHPRIVTSSCSNILIFAHEIGHALHLALTGNIEVMPNGFDTFNDKLNIKWETIHQKQEAFADVTALVLLNGEGITGLPTELPEIALDYYERYIGSLTKSYLEKI